MKKTLLIALLSIVLVGCSNNSELEKRINLNFNTSEAEIVLSEDNGFQQAVSFEWKIKNKSQETLDDQGYSLAIMSARPGAMEATYIHEANLNVESNETQVGGYVHLIDGISSEGDYEFQLVLSKKDGDYLEEIKRKTVPYTLHWRDKP
jgi:hypothetical protein